jgi:hypothetical protein
MLHRVRGYFTSQRSQSMAEFAIIAPVLVLMLFGIVDFGRAIYYYITINHAANEGARVAVRASYYIDPVNPSIIHSLPNNADVENAVKARAIATVLANPCPNGPIDPANQWPPANQGWIFVTQPNPPTTVQSSPPDNAPGGQSPANPAGCSAVNPAAGNEPLQVTVEYSFVPITPLFQQITQVGGRPLVLIAYATYRTEY